MVDFPSSPTNGQQHSEAGQTWEYADPPGCWFVVSGTGAVPPATFTSLSDTPGGYAGQNAKIVSVDEANSRLVFIENTGGGGGIPDAPDANNYVRRLGSWVASDALYRAAGATTVNTFNGRSGSVVPASADYSAFYYTQAQIDALLNVKVSSEPTIDGVAGSDQIVNMTSCTELEYANGTKDPATLYIITDAV